MSIRETIDHDLVASLRAKDGERVATLRLLKNNLKNTAIAKRMTEDKFSDEDVIAVIRQEVKKRKESIEAFTAGARPELAAKEKSELVILETYLPPNLDDATLTKIIQDVVAAEQLAPPYNFGKLMGAVVKQVAGRADGAAVKEAVQKFIG